MPCPKEKIATEFGDNRYQQIQSWRYIPMYILSGKFDRRAGCQDFISTSQLKYLALGTLEVISRPTKKTCVESDVVSY